MKQVNVELCIESFQAAKLAEKLGYDSIEVNSALSLGGLTPSLGLVRLVTENIKIKKYCMIRNRAAGFSYTDEEFEEMLAELEILIKENIDGIVFGFLTDEFEIDKDKTKVFVDKIHEAGKIAIFHRAFDNTNDPIKSIEDLIELEVDRVLTSGQTASALENMDLIKELIENYSEKIEFILGSGINENNVLELLKNTNANYVHSSCKTDYEDVTTNNKISYSVFTDSGNAYLGVDPEKAEKFVSTAKSYRG